MCVCCDYCVCCGADRSDCGGGKQRRSDGVRVSRQRPVQPRFEPGLSEPKWHTPDWALDAAQQVGIKSVNTIRESGVEVLGNLDALTTRIASTPVPDFTDQIPIDAAVTAMKPIMPATDSARRATCAPYLYVRSSITAIA